MITATLVLALVTTQRAGELMLARRNTTDLLSRGAHEIAPGHYPLLVALHGAWLASLWLFARGQPVDPIGLIVFLILQALRIWVIASLGSRWTTRVIIVPGAPLVTTGPYRLMAHPNYAIVACEIAVLPLALNLPIVALVFSILNAAVLSVRIRAEGRGLREPSQSTARS